MTRRHLSGLWQRRPYHAPEAGVGLGSLLGAPRHEQVVQDGADKQRHQIQTEGQVHEISLEVNAPEAVSNGDQEHECDEYDGPSSVLGVQPTTGLGVLVPGPVHGLAPQAMAVGYRNRYAT